ncbi:MAG: cytochrome b/b6 domain-containing protein [Gammaproteobacteria bacterium]|nr:cytochrome b/b6 domain-containing protein [Gammaproteobacteria bacterium]
MDSTKFRRVMIWGGWLRLSHACLALSTLVLLITGWLLAESPSLQGLAQDVHYMSAGFLLSGLAVRIVLMFAGKEHERVSSLLPASAELAAMASTLRFYISLGRVSLPGWYAQNPLWKPVYLVIYIAFLILAATGAAMSDVSLVLGFYLPSVHAFWAQVVLWFSVLHIAGVIMHDYKNQTTDISAMVNGYRLFIIDNSQNAADVKTSIQLVSPDSLNRRDGLD